MTLHRFRVVLVRPHHPGNVGAAARALKNMGIGQLLVVASPEFDLEAARAMAVHARDLIARCRVVADLTEAVADCGLVVGTTSRDSARERGAVGPRAAAKNLVSVARSNDVALVFGPEDHGLSNDELGLCQRVISIPTSREYPSLNLAQAVLLCAYEIFLAAAATGRDRPAERPLANSRRTERMYEALEDGLLRIGFLHKGNAAHMMAALRLVLGRAGLGDHDVQIFLGIARQMRWAAGHAHPEEKAG